MTSKTKTPKARKPPQRPPGGPLVGEDARALLSRVGRPTKISEPLIYSIADLVLAGNYRKVAAAACGVSYATLKRWMARGEELLDAEAQGEIRLDAEQKLYVELVEVLHVCEAQGETSLLSEARKAGSGWQAAMTILERRWPARWRRREELEHSGEVGARVSLTPEQAAEEFQTLNRAVAAMRAMQAGPDEIPAPEDA